jgi:hypothetical protein
MNNTYPDDSGTPSSDCSLAACRVIGSLPHSATVILDIQGYPKSGQSLHLIERHEKGGLIIPWSQVRVLAGPPSPMEIIDLWRREQGIRVPWSASIGGGVWLVGLRAGESITDTPLAAGAPPTRPVPGLPLTTPLGCPAPPPASREKCAVDIEAFCSQ